MLDASDARAISVSALCDPRRPARVNEAKFDALVQRAGDAPEHRQRMPLVIGVFQPANHGSGRADEFCELLLREARALAEFVNLARNRVVRLGLGQFGDSLRTPLVVAAMNGRLYCVSRGPLGYFFHRSRCWPLEFAVDVAGSKSNLLPIGVCLVSNCLGR